MRSGVILCIMLVGMGLSPSARAGDVRLLTAGAYRQVATALLPRFEAETGDRVLVESDTAGGVIARIEAGADSDVVVLTSQAIGDLVTEGKLASDSATDLARVGIGVAVKAGARRPDITTLAAFKQTLLTAKSIAYIDPKSGGSSGIYLAGLIDRLGLAARLKRKTILVPGGLVADRIADGSAEIGLQQMSELKATSTVDLVGPLPAEIQSFTTYGGGINIKARAPASARALLALLAGPAAVAVLAEKAMSPPAR